MTECPCHNSGGFWNSEFVHGVRMTLSSWQQNTDFCSGGLGLPHQQGWGSCSGILSTLITGATVFATSTKC